MAKCPVCNTDVAEGAYTCPQCGFKLQGRTEAFKPIRINDDDQQTSTLADQATLTIVAGPQVGNVFTLGNEDITVGRSLSSGIFLNDMTVSRNHCVIECRADGYYVVDQGSFNGVWVNNRNVHEACLKNGDRVNVGTFCLLFRSSED